MKICKFIHERLLIIMALLILAGLNLISKNIHTPPIIINKQLSSINVNNQVLHIFHLGQKRFISSLMWIATILESDTDHYKNKDLNSWMFLRFKTISELEPHFYENYIFGGQYLSIIKDDLSGATYIYEKGLAEYPNDFDLLKNAAFHFHFEVGDWKKSYPLYSKLKNHSRANVVMISILARLDSQNGNFELAFEHLKSQYDKLADKNSYIGSSIYEHMYAIKAEMDLDCLNLVKTKCNMYDLDGNKYISDGIKFKAEKTWVPFRPRQKK